VPEASPDEIFVWFKRQGLIERRFRSLKSDLQVHPLWLQRETRIQALLLLFVLALLVYTLLERCSERAGLSTPYYHKLTARELLYAFELVALSQVRIRGQPVEYHLHLTDHQEHLLQRLGLPDPLIYLKLT
jgi:transposase